MYAREDFVCPWHFTLAKIARAVRVSTCQGRLVYISSDYGGVHKSSKYETYSFLLVDCSSFREWSFRRMAVREQFLPDRRRMAYKSLNDVRRQQALVPFLDAANCLHGFAITIAVNKKVRRLCANYEYFSDDRQAFDLDKSWRPTDFERACRVTSAISLLCGLMTRAGHSIYWVSDNDNLLDGAARKRNIKKLLDHYSNRYIHHAIENVGFGTTQLGEEDLWDEDLNSIPDLTAGAIADATTILANEYSGHIPEREGDSVPVSLPIKADLLCSWIRETNSPLRKAVMVIEGANTGRYRAFKLDTRDAARD